MQKFLIIGSLLSTALTTAHQHILPRQSNDICSQLAVGCLRPGTGAYGHAERWCRNIVPAPTTTVTSVSTIST